jgi:orotidine-5'-phosphate decarboxylase
MHQISGNMEASNALALQPINKDQIIVALDVETADEARAIISELAGAVGAFKIGLQLFTAAGPSFVREIVSSGIKVFLDVKFHDIPNTVSKAAIEVARLGVWMFNIHALGGREMMSSTVSEAARFCDREGIERPLIIGVTVLTSSNQETLGEIGIGEEIDSQVLNLAKLTAECGLDGVVASPHEARMIRERIDDPKFLIVTPGIRPGFATNDDQKRVMTPGEAVFAGADHLVIGRPITQAADRLEAVRMILGNS